MCACVEIKTKGDLAFAYFLHRSGARSLPRGGMGNDSYFSLEGCFKQLIKMFSPLRYFCNFLFILCSRIKLDLHFVKSLAA